ncbi:hypothetical protein [Methylorubrum extorquens]|uniref:hypothetical protein n=1 Tax=Methylorubrum extorquens TaxID=408 RepID=UPI0011BEA462|nr:hypothetical protein [Methylorubrum extorquens]
MLLVPRKLPLARNRPDELDLGRVVAEIDYGVDCAGGELQRRPLPPLSFGVKLAALFAPGDKTIAALRCVEVTFVVRG